MTTNGNALRRTAVDNATLQRDFEDEIQASYVFIVADRYRLAKNKFD